MAITLEPDMSSLASTESGSPASGKLQFDKSNSSSNGSGSGKSKPSYKHIPHSQK